MSTATATPATSGDPAGNGAAIEFDRLTKRFGEHVAVDDMTFSVPRGSIFAFLGPKTRRLLPCVRYLKSKWWKSKTEP
jgi:hypothetical protein